MWSKEDLGHFPDYGKELNDAYAIYASIYLDYVDASLCHFHGRGTDVRPIQNIDSNDEAVLAKAYMDEARDIAKIEFDSLVDCGLDSTLKVFLAEYSSLLSAEDLARVA